MGVLVARKSKAQGHVTLSSAEAEHCDVTELVKEIMFVKQILDFLKINVKLPMPVHIDNIGAIQLVRNNTANTGTRHMNIKLHFVRDLHGKLVEYIYIRSENNTAGILTKNPTRAEYERHAPKLVAEIPIVLREVSDNEGDNDDID